MSVCFVKVFVVLRFVMSFLLSFVFFFWGGCLFLVLFC